MKSLESSLPKAVVWFYGIWTQRWTIKLLSYVKSWAQRFKSTEFFQQLLQVYCQKVDVTNRKTVYQAANEIRQNFGQIDILINNAGVLNPFPFLESDDEKMSQLIDVNVKSLFWTTKAFLPGFIEQGHGHIVTMGSIASIFGAPTLVDYGASKFAAFGFMESLCYQLHEQGHMKIKFTTICPYYVRTPLIDKLRFFLPWVFEC